MPDKIYKLTFLKDDNTEESVEFAAPQGPKGDKGDSGVYIGGDEPTDPNVNVWINPDGETAGGVLYTHQNLTENQKKQALENIGAASAEDVEQLSEEIDNLREEGGISGTNDTASGTLVNIRCDVGTDIEVTSASTEAVTVIHQGKNFVSPLERVIKIAGVTVNANYDGTLHIEGTSATSGAIYAHFDQSQRGIYIPAGQYVITTNWPEEYGTFCFESKDGASIGMYVTRESGEALLTLRTGGMFGFCFSILANVTVNMDVWAQIEIGNSATAYESPVRIERTAELPITLTAYNGTNIIFTDSEETLSVSYEKNIDAIIDEAVARRTVINYAQYGLPTLYLTGNTDAMTKDHAVDLAYVYGNMSGTASVKWQGSSSVAYPKKNYTIKFDEAFEAKEGWGVQTKYCLKANWIDATHARNIVAAKLWGQIIANRSEADADLAACPNYGAVDGFPCIIMLNGEFLGLYTWNIPKDGWMLNFPTEGATQQCILCAKGLVQPNSDLFMVLETELGHAFDVEYITDENNTEWALTSLNNLIGACLESDGTDLDTVLAQMIDWDSVIDYMCFTAAFGNYDGISKNYLIYTRDGTKWHMGAYDLDCLWGNWWNGKYFIKADYNAHVTSFIYEHKLFQLVCKYKKEELKARYAALRVTVLSEDNVATEMANFIGSIPNEVFNHEHKAWPTLPMTAVNNLAQITDWYRRRVAIEDKLMEGF